MSTSGKFSRSARGRPIHHPVELPAGRYQSVAGYAADHNLSRVAVQYQIQRGELVHVRIGNVLLIKLSKDE